MSGRRGKSGRACSGAYATSVPLTDMVRVIVPSGCGESATHTPIRSGVSALRNSLGDQEVGRLGQATGREGQDVLCRPRSGGLRDLAALGQCERSRPSALVLGTERVEAAGVEIVDHVVDPVRAGERHLRDLRHGHAPDGQQHRLGPPPGHHRTGAPTDDPEKRSVLVVADLTHLHVFSHVIILTGRCRPAQQPGDTSQRGERCPMRH